MKIRIFIGLLLVCVVVSLFIVFDGSFIFSDLLSKHQFKRLKNDLKQSPYSAELHYKLAQYYLDQGKLNEYEGELLVARQINPEAYLYAEKLAEHYFKIGKYEEAIAHYNEVLKLNRNDGGLTYFKIGNSYNNLGKARDALAYYEKQVELLESERNVDNQKMIAFIKDIMLSLKAHLPEELTNNTQAGGGMKIGSGHAK